MPNAALVGAYASRILSIPIRVGVSSVFEDVNISLGLTRRFPTGDGSPSDFLTFFRGELTEHSQLNVGNVSVTLIDGRVRIATSASNIGISDWRGFPSRLLGWPGPTGLSSGGILDAPNTCPLVWLPRRRTSDDTLDRQVIGQGRSTTWVGTVTTTRWPNARKRRSFGFDQLERTAALELYAQSDRTAFETFDREVLSLGQEFRYYPDETTISSGGPFTAYYMEESAELREIGNARWDVQMQMRRATV